MPRRKQFDPEQVLEKAMHVFWAKGYEATSVQDLVDAMGINRFSLYQTFTDKRRLYQLALERYLTNVLAQLNDILGHPDADIRTIRIYFQTLSASLSSPLGRRGCFGQNAGIELAALDPETTEPVRITYTNLVEALRTALDRSVSTGSVRSTIDTVDAARYLVTLAQGMIVMTKTSGDPHYLGSSYRHVLAYLAALSTESAFP